jgi:hypothetical protein
MAFPPGPSFSQPSLALDLLILGQYLGWLPDGSMKFVSRKTK